MAKIIVHGDTRDEAVTLMRRALKETIIEGIATTIPLHLRVLEHADFLAGKVDTGFLDTNLIPLLED